MNKFKIKSDFAEQFETQWRNRQSFLSENPGYIRFRLLKSKLPQNEVSVELVSYTEWIDEVSFLNWMNGDGAKKAHSSNDAQKVPPEAYLGPPEFRGFEVCLEQTIGHRTDYSSPHMDSLVEKHFAIETENQKVIPKVSAEQGLPPIQVGAFEGRILEIMLKISRSKKGIEIGTLGGYSTTWLARGVGPGGQVISLELDPKRAALAQRNLNFLSTQNIKAEVIAGDAMASLDKIKNQGPFDFVFIDADKARYPKYTEWAIENLKSGGLILCDNAYIWGGMNQYGKHPDELKYPKSQESIYSYSKNEFKGMSECWSLLEKDPRLDSVILPTGEGLAIAVKK